MGRAEKLRQISKKMKEFPATLAAQTHRTVWVDLFSIYDQFKNSIVLQRSLMACVFVSILTVTFRWGTELGNGLNASTVKFCCRMIAILVFFFIRENLLFPFCKESIHESFKNKVLPTLLNELMRIVLQTTTAYMCGYDLLSSVLICFLWCFASVITTITVLDLSVYNKVLYHSETKLKPENKKLLEDGLKELDDSIEQKYKQFWYYVWFQYIIYFLNTMFHEKFQRFLMTSGSFIIGDFSTINIAVIFKSLHILIICCLVFSIYRFHSKKLGHQFQNIQMVRFCLMLMVTHIIFGITWTHYILPKFQITSVNLQMSGFWIGVAGCLSLFTIASNELKSLIPGLQKTLSESFEEKSAANQNFQLDQTNSTVNVNNNQNEPTEPIGEENKEKLTKHEKKVKRLLRRMQQNKTGEVKETNQNLEDVADDNSNIRIANQLIVENSDKYFEIASVPEGKRLKIFGNPYIITPHFPQHNVLVQLYDYLLLLQVESKFSPTIQIPYYILLYSILTPAFLWVTHPIWILVFLVCPL